MTDVLIRDVPDDDLREIDEAAERLGLSRAEYLRREMRRIARHRAVRPATTEDYDRSVEAMADLGDPDVMGRAWS